jgi:hypothetical protein
MTWNKAGVAALASLVLVWGARGAEFGLSPAWPCYDEVEPGKWTMNFEGAMAAAKVTGRNVYVLFAAMEWCPHCKAMDVRVFNQPSFQTDPLVANAYLVTLDFPRRDEQIDCLQKDPAWLNAVGITKAQGAQITARNWNLHNYYTLPGGTRVGFPTLVVFNKDGETLGRTGEHGSEPHATPTTPSTYDPVPVILDNIRQAVAQEGSESDNHYSGAIELALPSIGGGANTVQGSLSKMDAQDWFRFSPQTAGTYTFTVSSGGLSNATLNAYHTPWLPAVASVTGSATGGGLVLPVTLESLGETYYLRVAASGLSDLAGYAVSVAAGPVETGTVALSPKALRVRRDAAAVAVDVTLRRHGATGVVEAEVSSEVLQGAADAAVAGTHFALVTQRVELAEGVAETNITVNVPLADGDAGAWRGDVRFLVSAHALAGAVVTLSTQSEITITETRVRGASQIALIGYSLEDDVEAIQPFAKTTKGIEFSAVAGSKPYLWVARSGALDGQVDAKLSYTLPGEDAVSTKTLTWAAGEGGLKSAMIYTRDQGDASAAYAQTVTMEGTPLYGIISGPEKVVIVVIPVGAPQFTAGASAYTLWTRVVSTIELPVKNEISDAIQVKKTKDSKLPSGLTMKAVGNKVSISGVPKKEGEYPLTLQLFAKKGRQSVDGETRTFTITVKSITQVNPAPTGTFDGSVRSADAASGTLALTVSSSGKVSAKVRLDATTTESFSAKGWTSTDGAETLRFTASSRNGALLDVAVAANGGLAGGFVKSGEARFVYGGRRGAGPVPAGYYTAAVLADAGTFWVADPELDNRPAGHGYLTASVSDKGSVKYAGLLADGTRVSGSAYGFNGDPAAGYWSAPLVAAPYTRRGVFSGVLVPDPSAGSGVPADPGLTNGVSLKLGRWIYPGKGTGRGDAFDVAVGAVGKAFDKTVGLTGLDGKLFVLGAVDWLGALPGPLSLAASSNGKSASVPDGKAAGVTSFAANARTGLFAGKIKAVDAVSGKTVLLNYKGVIVAEPVWEGAGFFLVADPQYTVPYRLKRSYPVLIE